MGNEIMLPVLVAGERVDSADEFHRVKYEGGVEVQVPAPSYQALEKAIATDRDLLQDVSIEEILSFFNEVATQWNDPENPWRKLALQLGSQVTGYHQDIMMNDVRFVGGCMVYHDLYDLIETDLGDPTVLDHWTRYKAIYYRAWPKGLAAHVMVGNVPLAGFFTIVRSLATKNITIAKTSRRDVVVPQCLAQCMYDVDSDHPVVRALTTMYWEAESDIENLVLRSADVVTVWGRANSIESVKQRLPYGAELIEFGPKRSFAVFLDGVQDWDTAAMWLGFDIINYNQEACFSVQEVFVIGNVEPVVERLGYWLAEYAKNVAPTETTPDAEVHIHRTRIEALAQGWRVLAPEGADWTIIVTDGPTELTEHPLGRTVYIHPCRDVAEAVATVDEHVQTVAVEPFDRAWEIADRIAGAGADRLVPLGRTGRSWPPGFIHDGFHPMRRMVRWSAIEPKTGWTYRASNFWRDREAEDRSYREWATGKITYAQRSIR